MIVTHFKSKSAVDWDICDLDFSKPLPNAIPKNELPLWSLAEFCGPRCFENTVSVRAVVFDVDIDPIPALEDIRAAMEDLDGFVYSSSSATTEAPRWRLCITLDEPCPASDYKKLGRFVASMLPFPVAHNSIEAAHLWYVPRVSTEGNYVFESFEGKCLPVTDLLRVAPEISELEAIDAPPPPDLSPELLALRISGFEAYCQTTQEDGIDVAAKARCYELPINTAAEIIERIYAPRCAALDPPQPWPVDNIRWKLKRVYSGILRASLVFGPNAWRPSPPGWLERMFNRVTPGTPLPPTDPDPEHVYSYEAGMRRMGSADKTSFGDIQSELYDNKEWYGVFTYDLFRARVRAVNPPVKLDAETPSGLSDIDVENVRGWLEYHEMKCNSNDVRNAIEVVARRRSYHPVQDYLRGLQWDGTGRLDRVLPEYFESEDGPYERAIGPRWFISLVARAMTPGCQSDCTLILEGDQGIGKTSAFRALMYDPTWYAESSAGVDSKDFFENLRGVWLMGFDELDSLTRSSLTRVKTVLTSVRDRYRQSYGHFTQDYPRACGFCGSTNAEQYFNDPTGARRLWPVRVLRQISVAKIVEAREMIWAEAYERFVAGEHWHVDTPELRALCEAEQEARLEVDPWEEAITTWLQDPTKVSYVPLAPPSAPAGGLFHGVALRLYDASEGVTTAGVLEHAIGKLPGQWTNVDAQRVGKCLRRLGLRRVRQNNAGIREWKYVSNKWGKKIVPGDLTLPRAFLGPRGTAN